jgi:hypothetical protein
MVLAFVIPVGSGLFDFAQTVIRIWNPDYDNGLPSVLLLFLAWLPWSFACIVVIAAVQKR